MNPINEITVLINAIRDLCDVGICYYDLKNFFNYNKYGVQNNRGHYCEFCKRARALPNGREYCEKSDKEEAVKLAEEYKEPFLYECHMGMREMVIPLYNNTTLLGIIFVGQCRLDNNYDSKIRANAEKISGDPDEFSRLYNMLPLHTVKDLANIRDILARYFDAKIQNKELFSSNAEFNDERHDLADLIKQYINLNYAHRLTLNDISEALHTNASYASRSFSERWGITITGYINQIRIERAKILLLTTDAPIGSIALNSGFDDINYFSRVFKKITGVSPMQYRNRE